MPHFRVHCTLQSQFLIYGLLVYLLSSIPTVFSQATNATNLPVGSCSPDIPCSNQACCNGNTGFCGFGMSFCTPISQGGNCTSNCGALAECGPDAAPSNFTCPLGVCCSEFGFCGTTDDFCGTGCQLNCSSPTIPSCGDDQQSALARRIGYYEGWATSRSCMSFTPEQIPASSLTHINFAFALISSNFEVIPMNSGDQDLWSRTTNLKANAPALKVFLSIGGWSFNDPPTQFIFSDLVASSTNTEIFIGSVLQVLETFGFDGIDVDWEYPGASDRGGIPADTENYVNFMKAVKSAFIPSGYGLTFTAPSSYWYLQHYDLPGMLQQADWVNIMTYDLHGVWDGIDPEIGYVLGAHTNLTEIDEAFQLFWRVGVNPSQMVMGMGFYGRSFTLADPSCFDPPCAWVSGGDAGPCSDNSGTLMFAEIETVLESSSVQEIFDEIAAVKYIVWDSNQWVSYDDQDSFALKMNYANDRCIGGTMIWSMDQDDTSYTALNDLYPGLSALTPKTGDIDSGDECVVSACGEKTCGSGKVSIATVTTNPASPGTTCKSNKPALLCCPSANAPQSCQWRGKVPDSSICNPSCNVGEIIMATDPVGDGKEPCLKGEQALCCSSNLASLGSTCSLSDCTTTPSCPNVSTLITVGTRGQGTSQQEDCTGSTQQCPQTCSDGQVKPYCCSEPIPYENCQWVGTPPLCLDNACAAGQVQLLTDPQGDASSPCVGSETRAYCCDPAGSNFVPVPFDDIFPSNVPTSGSESFTVDIDQDMGTSQSGSSAKAVDTDEPKKTGDEPTEEFEPFGEVFIDSPNPASVSSLSIEADWTIVGCDATSDQPQAVAIYCSKLMNDSSSGCGHVFIGQAEQTIVKMPSSCGKGPYARVVGLVMHPDQSILSPQHNSKKPASEPVYLLNFDYSFAEIPESNGPVYMRVDASDVPDYWDTVVDSPPERRQWMEERGLWKEKTHTKRWWGAFTDWLNKLNTVTSESSTTRQFQWTDTYPIFSQKESCDGPPAFESSMDITVDGSAQFSARYGFYLQGQIVPPSVQAAYLYFSSDAEAAASFTVKGTASVTYDSSMIQLASFGFPGLYYPGILTIGPSLVLEGYITGQLSISGEYKASLSYKFPSVDLVLGQSSSDEVPGTVKASADAFNQPTTQVNWNVDLQGDLSVHIVPQVQMGISILGGALVDAQAFIRADLGGGISITGSVSNIEDANICINPYFFVEFDAGITGSLVFWETGPFVWPLYSNQYNFPEGGICPSSLERRAMDNLTSWTVTSQPLKPDPWQHSVHSSGRGAYIREVGKDGVERIIKPLPPKRSSKHKRDVPFIPGNLFCPAVGDQISGADGGAPADFDPYDDLTVVNLQDAFERREERPQINDVADITSFNISHVISDAARKVTVAECSNSANPINVNAPPYTGTKTLGYFDLQSPGSISVNSDYMSYTKSPATDKTGVVYGREHVYELQMLSIFIDSLVQVPNLWNMGGTDFCSWAKKYLDTPYFPGTSTGNGLSVTNSLQRCLPATVSKNTDSGLTSMFWLENIANGAKASAVSGTTFRDIDKFMKTYQPVKQVSVFRAAAGVISYMNNGYIMNQFMATHTCVDNVWQSWALRYTNDPALPLGNFRVQAAAAWSFGQDNLYRTWVLDVVGNIPVNIAGYLTAMANAYTSDASGEIVPLDYAGNLRNEGAQGIIMAQITQQDLQAEVIRLSGQSNRLLSMI